MKWEKKNKIFEPINQFGWIKSHAQVPTAIFLESKNVVRIFFSTRPKTGTTQATYLDLNPEKLNLVEYINDKPILDHGKNGTFDEHGIMPSSAVKYKDQIYLYYSGWQRSVGVPYNNYTGLAISSDEGYSFKKFSEAPIIDRNSKELFSATSPCVKYINEKWHMWYCSGTNWHLINGKYEHTYDIKYAKSDDGKNWIQTGIVCIKQRDKYEAITKPSVIYLNDKFHMWFCYRGSKNFRDGINSYRIGYASSKNGIKWERDDKLSGIEVSSKGWDSKMIAYPEVIKLKDKIYMFYNGNSFGKNGFGFAELKNI